MLHLWCKGAALLLALLFESLYSGFSVGRRTLFLHSHCCIALCEPAATEQKTKKRSRNITDFFRSLYGSVFWFFRFDFLLTWIVPWQDKWDFRRIFLLIVPWQDKRDLRRILVWGQVWEEKVYPHTYPHHWNPDKQGVSDEKWGCEGKKRKKVFFK